MAEKEKLADASQMSEDEWNKALDEWVEERNKKIGEIFIPPVGIYPPEPKAGLETGINNEWVTTDLIRHYADALGDKNPLWRDEQYCRRTRWGGIIAPPTFIDCIAPTFTQDKTSMPPGARALPAGAKRQWFQVMRPGDRIHVVDQYTGVEEKKHKKKKPYRMFFDNTRRTYINQREEIVAVADCPLIMPVFHLFEDQKSALDQNTAKHRYTQEELDEIHRNYEEVHPRGADTLFWEDVSVDDELEPIIAGPLSGADGAAFCAAIGYLGAFGINWEFIKASFSWHHIDPETGEYNRGSEVHFNDITGKIRGGTRSFTFGAQSEGMLCRLITNWMGDDGFMKRLDAETRRPWYFGDTVWVKGKVTKKYSEDNEHLVDLEVYCENQEGTINETGTSTVRLLSRKDHHIL